MKTKKENWITAIGFLCAGVAAIVFAIICFATDCYSWGGIYVYHEHYGGDAYTGIQNAAADTARNVIGLGHFLGTCFGFVLMVAGVVIVTLGVKNLLPLLKKDEKVETISNDTNN